MSQSMVSIDNVVAMVHAWLKENHLLKTARTLKEEYGKEIQDTDSASNIMQYLSMMHGVFSMFSKQTESLEKKEKKKSKKRNTGENKDLESKSRAVSEDVCNNKSKNKDSQEIEKPIKKVKKPLVPPGEWVCPEMEGRLVAIFDRTHETEIQIQNDSAVNTKIDSLLTISKEFSTNKQTILSLSSSDDEIESKTITRKQSITTPKKTDPVDSESSDSDDDDVTKTQKTIVKLSNGLTLTTPAKDNKKKKNDKKKTDATVEKAIETDSINDGTKSAVKKKRKREEKDEADVTDESKKKKKKKKKIIDDSENIDVTNALDEVDLTDENKKKKKKKTIGDSENSDLTSTSNESETKKKKKKKKMTDNSDNVDLTISDENDEKVKKKKKKKKKSHNSGEDFLVSS